MYNMMSANVTFFHVLENDSLIDYVEKYGYSEYDENEENLILTIEENYDMESIDDILEWIKNVIDIAETNNIIMIGKIDNSTKNSTHAFEIIYSNDKLKYRETVCDMEEFLDDDLTYEEYQEEGILEMDEEEFEDYHRKKNKKSRKNNRDDEEYDLYDSEFSDWIYVNLE